MNHCKTQFKQRGRYMKSQFIESLKRLYIKHIINYNKVYSLFEDGKITEEDRDYILAE